MRIVDEESRNVSIRICSMWDVEITSAALVVALMSRELENFEERAVSVFEIRKSSSWWRLQPPGVPKSWSDLEDSFNSLTDRRRNGKDNREFPPMVVERDANAKGHFFKLIIVVCSFCSRGSRCACVCTGRWKNGSKRRNFWWVNNMEIGADYSRWNAQDARFEYSSKRTNSSCILLKNN